MRDQLHEIQLNAAQVEWVRMGRNDILL